MEEKGRGEHDQENTTAQEEGGKGVDGSKKSLFTKW